MTTEDRRKAFRDTVWNACQGLNSAGRLTLEELQQRCDPLIGEIEDAVLPFEVPAAAGAVEAETPAPPPQRKRTKRK